MISCPSKILLGNIGENTQKVQKISASSLFTFSKKNPGSNAKKSIYIYANKEAIKLLICYIIFVHAARQIVFFKTSKFDAQKTETQLTFHIFGEVNEILAPQKITRHSHFFH